MKRHKVLIADDDSRARDGLISLLAIKPADMTYEEAAAGVGTSSRKRRLT